MILCFVLNEWYKTSAKSTIKLRPQCLNIICRFLICSISCYKMGTVLNPFRVNPEGWKVWLYSALCWILGRNNSLHLNIVKHFPLYSNKCRLRLDLLYS